MALATIKLYAKPEIRELTCIAGGPGFVFNVTTSTFMQGNVTFALEMGWLVDDFVAGLQSTGYFDDDAEVDPEEAGAKAGTLIAGTYTGTIGASTRPGMDGRVSISIPVTYTP